MPPFYQDRLGTNIGKEHSKKTARFSQVLADGSGLRSSSSSDTCSSGDTSTSPNTWRLRLHDAFIVRYDAGKKNAISAMPFYTENEPFIKTGSGQT
jgi:hypothetical protein